jgi:hypothetical protein
MTTVRTHGFDSAAQLREYLLDLEDETSGVAFAEDAIEPSDPASALREIGWLRKEVADLSEGAAALHERIVRAGAKRSQAEPWPRLAWMVAAAFVVGSAAQIWRSRP